MRCLRRQAVHTYIMHHRQLRKRCSAEPTTQCSAIRAHRHARQAVPLRVQHLKRTVRLAHVPPPAPTDAGGAQRRHIAMYGGMR